MERVLVVRLGWLRGGVGTLKLHVGFRSYLAIGSFCFKYQWSYVSLVTLPEHQALFYGYYDDLVLCTSTSLMLLRRLLLIHMSSSRAKRVVATACHRSD